MKGLKITLAALFMILGCIKVLGQNADFYKQKIEDCLSRNDARNAQIMYDAWKELTKRTDADIERRIDETSTGYIEFADKKIAVQMTDIGVNVTYESALLMCKNSSKGGFYDWRLPGPNELMFLFTERSKIGNFDSGLYWVGYDQGVIPAESRHVVTHKRIETTQENTREIRVGQEGFVYSETQISPTLENAERTGNGGFPHDNLKTNTKYYYRDYVRWIDGQLEYGDVRSYTTPAVKVLDFRDGNIVSLDDYIKNTGRFNVRCVRNLIKKTPQP